MENGTAMGRDRRFGGIVNSSTIKAMDRRAIFAWRKSLLRKPGCGPSHPVAEGKDWIRNQDRPSVRPRPRMGLRGAHFALAAALTFRNLFIMRQLLLIFALACAVTVTRAADNGRMTTNSIDLGKPGTLQVLLPHDWTLVHTNLGLPNNPPTVEFHAPTSTTVIRLSIYWDGFAGTNSSPGEADMLQIVSNVVTRQYLPISVEKTFEPEKFHGPGVSGVFARITDAGWTPVVKDEYPNLATGMFRAGNIWGNFDLLCFDRDGPQFKAGLAVMQSLRRKP